MLLIKLCYYLRISNIEGGLPRNPEIIVGSLCLLGECCRSPSLSVYQLVLLWEAVFGFSDFFLRLFQYLCPFHDGWFRSALAHSALSIQQILTKSSMTPMHPMLHPPYLPDLTPASTTLMPGMKNVLRGKHLVDVEEVKQTLKGTKGHENLQVQKLFWAVEKISIASNWEYSEGDWILNM